MLTSEMLLNKGFIHTVYENQIGKPAFYTKQFEQLEDVIKLHNLFGESIGEFDYSYDSLYCVVEIDESLTKGQYLFAEKKHDYGYSAHDPLTVKEFEQLLNAI